MDTLASIIEIAAWSTMVLYTILAVNALLLKGIINGLVRKNQRLSDADERDKIEIEKEFKYVLAFQTLAGCFYLGASRTIPWYMAPVFISFYYVPYPIALMCSLIIALAAVVFAKEPHRIIGYKNKNRYLQMSTLVYLKSHLQRIFNPDFNNKDVVVFQTAFHPELPMQMEKTRDYAFKILNGNDPDVEIETFSGTLEQLLQNENVPDEVKEQLLKAVENDDEEPPTDKRDLH